MFVRLILVGALLIAGLVYVKQERVLARIGLVGTCVTIPPPADLAAKHEAPQWWSCSEGVLAGYPSLELKSCDTTGIYGQREIWYCPESIETPY